MRNLDAAIAAFTRSGGEVVSAGGLPVAVPAGASTQRAAIVRDPSNLFVVLIKAPPGVRGWMTGRVYTFADVRFGWEPHVRINGGIGIRL